MVRITMEDGGIIDIELNEEHHASAPSARESPSGKQNSL